MSEITWKYVKPLNNTNAIATFEKEHSVSFPSDLKEILSNNNGGRPSVKYYDTKTEKDKEFKTLLSFNEEDIEFPFPQREIRILPEEQTPSDMAILKAGLQAQQDTKSNEPIDS